jgi:hypothetical protein
MHKILVIRLSKSSWRMSVLERFKIRYFPLLFVKLNIPNHYPNCGSRVTPGY